MRRFSGARRFVEARLQDGRVTGGGTSARPLESSFEAASRRLRRRSVFSLTLQLVVAMKARNA